jgi:glycosyltransferase involved in cell wall biosynthesis
MIVATILIPAHNEEAVIGRTLWNLSRGLPLEDFRVVVIANGCLDATAARAQTALPQAEIIETDRAGKCHALNLGYEVSTRDAPIICLDADLDVTAESLAALVAPLRSGVSRAACGRMDVATSEASLLVRSFYLGWRTNPYFNQGKFGGLFALSPQGAARVFPLPDITADDEFIRRSFDPAEITFVPECCFLARAPAKLASLVKVRRRSLRGAREIANMGKLSPERGSLKSIIFRALTKPADVVPISVFVMVMIWVRLLLALEGQKGGHQWERDLTTRNNV